NAGFRAVVSTSLRWPRRLEPVRANRAPSSVSEVDLAPEPEQVGSAAENATRVDEDGRSVGRVLPVEIEFDPAVRVPVDAQVDHPDVVGPERTVGEAVLEDDIPQIELAVADVRLDSARPPFAFERPERPHGHDSRPTLDLLARDEVAQHGVES